MEYPIIITDKLRIDDICNVFTGKPDSNPILVDFSFYGESGHIVLSREEAESTWADYSNAEFDTVLFASFETAIEDNWDAIKEAIRKFLIEEGE